jgi:hypothetical protein
MCHDRPLEGFITGNVIPDDMKGWAGFLLLAVGFFFLFLSGIFFIGGLSPPIDGMILATAGVLLFMGLIPIGAYIMLKKGEKAPEVRIEQKVEIRSDDLVSGKRKFQEMKCRSCSGPLTSDNIKLGDMGLSVKCPYCGIGYSIEEEPRW